MLKNKFVVQKLHLKILISKLIFNLLFSLINFCFREIAELNKTKAATESKVVEATLSAEILLREEIRMAVDKERLISRQEQEKLQMTIDELRHSIQRSEIQLNRKEQSSRQEINDLRQVNFHRFQILKYLNLKFILETSRS